MEVCVRKGRVNQSFYVYFSSEVWGGYRVARQFFYSTFADVFSPFFSGIVEMRRLNLGNWEETAGAEELAFEPALKMLKGLGCQATKGSVIFFPLESRLFFN